MEDTTSAKNSQHSPRIITAAELVAQEFPEPRWAVPGIAPAGLILFGGKAKMGKSWLMLGLCIAVATGGHAFGKIPVELGEALYLALEDNERRLKKRLRKLLQDRPAPEGLHITTTWRRLDDGGLEQLDAFLEDHPRIRLVGIDTLKKVRPAARGNRSMYETDYEAGEPLVGLAHKHDTAIVLLHHLNQLQNLADPFDAFSGSEGLNAGVDSMLLLTRQRGEADAVLHVDGRDIEDRGELALRWDAEAATWTLMGDAAEYRISEERRKIREAIDEAGEPVGPGYVADTLEKNHSTIRTLMSKMVRDGQLRMVSGGKYTTITPVDSVDSVDSGGSVYGVHGVHSVYGVYSVYDKDDSSLPFESNGEPESPGAGGSS